MKLFLKTPSNSIKNSVTIVSIAIVMLFFVVSCDKPRVEITDKVTNRQETPQLSAYAITTIVSDSGVIRYRISSDEWKVYDKAESPYWDFPLGLHFERFDKNYLVDAQIVCKQAVYLQEEDLWILNDSVRATNLNGERFETQQLFWNQKSQRVYSDSLIRIIQEDKIIIGVGFESNQTFTRYDIHQPKGMFPIDTEEERDSTDAMNAHKQQQEDLETE